MNAITQIKRHETLRAFVKDIVFAAYNGQVSDMLAAATGIGEGLGSIGGYLASPAIATEVWSKVYSTGTILGRCTKQPITRKAGIEIPAISEVSRADGSRFGGVRSYFVDEGGQATVSKPKFDQINFDLRKLLTLIYATDELVQDVAGLVAFLERVMALEIQFTFEDKIISGTGAGVPLGVMNSGALITVAAEGAQPTGTVVMKNLEKMAARLWGPSHASAVWLMNNDIFQLIMDLGLSAGFQLFETGPNGERMLLQMPVILSEYTATAGSAGDIMLCDFSQYLVSDQESAIEQSIHVQFVTDETVFKVRSRVEGQPAWKSAITPKNSAVTQSPFIALAARP